jgi:hypothetical protein
MRAHVQRDYWRKRKFYSGESLKTCEPNVQATWDTDKVEDPVYYVLPRIYTILAKHNSSIPQGDVERLLNTCEIFLSCDASGIALILIFEFLPWMTILFT